MAEDKKNASRLKAGLVFIDESGFLMAPWVRRTWAPRGQTPLLYQRGRAHQKVSVIAALCITARRDHLRCYFRLHPGANIRTPQVVAFLRQLARQLNRERFLVIWDRLQAHRPQTVQTILHTPPALGSYFLPAYAPELNPVEMLWGYLKTHPLANAPCYTLEDLRKSTHSHGRAIQRQEHLLRSFIEHVPLSLRLH